MLLTGPLPQQAAPPASIRSSLHLPHTFTHVFPNVVCPWYPGSPSHPLGSPWWECFHCFSACLLRVWEAVMEAANPPVCSPLLLVCFNLSSCVAVSLIHQSMAKDSSLLLYTISAAGHQFWDKPTIIKMISWHSSSPQSPNEMAMTKAALSKLGWRWQLHPVKDSLQTRPWLPFHSGVLSRCFCKLVQTVDCRSLQAIIRAVWLGNDWYEVSYVRNSNFLFTEACRRAMTVAKYSFFLQEKESERACVSSGWSMQ